MGVASRAIGETAGEPDREISHAWQRDPETVGDVLQQGIGIRPLM